MGTLMLTSSLRGHGLMITLPCVGMGCVQDPVALVQRNPKQLVTFLRIIEREERSVRIDSSPPL